MTNQPPDPPDTGDLPEEVLDLIFEERDRERLSQVNGPLYTWAQDAAKLRFGPHAIVGYEEDGTCVVSLEEPGKPSRFLAKATTWPKAIEAAKESGKDIQQPPVRLPDSMPSGPETIEEFCQIMRQRDVFSQFLLWYGEKMDAGNENLPHPLYHGEWLERFIEFLNSVK